MRFNLWCRYDLTKAVYYLQQGGWRLRAHVIVIGPLGFVVLWRTKEAPDAAP